ncbi:MAG: PIN domain-containing protein [Thermoproteota archaeon]
MRSNQKLRILLDTSFVLPTLGIDTGREVSESLRKLDEVKAELYYSRFSILESLWIVAKLAKNNAFDADRFSQGLRSILEGGRYKGIEENSKVFEEAIRLRIIGHRDMIDNVLYSTSLHFNLKLLTLDDELKEFVRKNKLNDVLISPNQIIYYDTS